jgi:hypothetical protein
LGDNVVDVFNLPEPLQQKLRSELKPGESLHWAGQPDPGRFMRRGFLLWLFFIPWTAFSLFGTGMAYGFSRVAPSPFNWFPLFGLPFVLVGLGGLALPFWRRYKARTIIYAVTDQRAITIEGGFSTTVRSYLLANLGGIERKEYRDGYGDLVLRKETFVDSEGSRSTREEGFFAIADVRRVENVVTGLMPARAARDGSAGQGRFG